MSTIKCKGESKTLETKGFGLDVTDKIIYGVYFILYLVVAIVLVVNQPFGDPPDEAFRFLIPQFIGENGSLPNGFDESIRIAGYGFSYAFQPILPYMIQGLVLRILGIFTKDLSTWVLAARFVNVFFGLGMAAFVALIGRMLFKEKRYQYVFAFLITFLPQALFLHTYVNTDSCCMLSIAIIIYALLVGIKKNFPLYSNLLLALGVILCALSYYNAYGYIVSAVILFIAFHIKRGENGALKVDWKTLGKRFALVSAVVLAGISWWFIRSGILYDGDILGLKTRDACALLYAEEQFHPDTRITWQSQGYSLFQMMKDSDFFDVNIVSFIGVLGSMKIVLSIWIYRFYKMIIFGGLLLCLIPAWKKTDKGNLMSDECIPHKIIFHINMWFCILMPLILSLWYSYSTDYQPQGRYVLPSLVPLMFYVVRGVEKFEGRIKWVVAQISKKEDEPKAMSLIFNILSALVVAGIVISILAAVFGYVLPYYKG